MHRQQVRENSLKEEKGITVLKETSMRSMVWTFLIFFERTDESESLWICLRFKR
jgi:hypothetical protein